MNFTFADTFLKNQEIKWLCKIYIHYWALEYIIILN